MVSHSYSLIKNRIFQPGYSFSQTDIDLIISDITSGKTSPLEASVFITSQIFQAWTIEEIGYLTKAIAYSGNTVEWDGAMTFDKHSLGGVPGNKVTLLIVPIVAAAGLKIPKTSSRAITSPSGTADTVEALGASIKFTLEEMKEIVNGVGGLFAWTEGLGIVPADGKIIKDVQFPLGIDPEPMMMASIIAKKVAMGIKFLALDIPTGIGTKVKDLDTAKRLAHRFAELGRNLGVQVESGMTYGSSPVGHAIGPALEAREAIASLRDPQHASESLIGKSTSLAGILLEMSGKVLAGNGTEMARKILLSGKAYQKFQEILESQNGDPNIKPEDIEVGSEIYEYKASQNGWVVEINNKVITRAARKAGAPKDKKAGIQFFKKKDSVKRGDIIFCLHASSSKNLEMAEAELAKSLPVTIEGMLLARE